MEYIIGKKHGTLTRGTKVHKIGNWICKGNEPLFYATSQSCYDCAMPNNDGHGLERFDLKEEINSTLKANAEKWEEEVHKALMNLEDDSLENQQAVIASIPDPNADFFARLDHKYRKNGVWSYDFQTASLDELRQIKSLLD